MKTYKAALVGYGGMGRWHKTGICQTPRVCIDGVYDINPARMDAAREDGITTAYPSFEALLADPAAVSYTHLDVYKRQVLSSIFSSSSLI